MPARSASCAKAVTSEAAITCPTPSIAQQVVPGRAVLASMRCGVHAMAVIERLPGRRNACAISRDAAFRPHGGCQARKAAGPDRCGAFRRSHRKRLRADFSPQPSRFFSCCRFCAVTRLQREDIRRLADRQLIVGHRTSRPAWRPAPRYRRPRGTKCFQLLNRLRRADQPAGAAPNRVALLANRLADPHSGQVSERQKVRVRRALGDPHPPLSGSRRPAR